MIQIKDFDIDNYADIYQKDLIAAEKEIIIVTWKPDSYGYGNSAYWHELQEQMRKAGFEMNLVEDYCEHYCIIDRQVVWYGSMSFRGKEL